MPEIRTDPAVHRTEPELAAAQKRRGAYAAAGAVLACAIACSLPLLVGAGVLASAGAFFVGAEGMALAVLVAVVVVIGWYARTRRRAAAASGSAASACRGQCRC